MSHTKGKMTAGGNAVVRPNQPWTGTGLPPVGAACAFEYHPSLPWVEVKVIAHFFDGKKNAAAVLMTDSTGSVSVDQGYAENFRPIRTPEQIAAEEREKAVDQMMADYEFKVGSCTYHLSRDQAERIYDAGYRKSGHDH